MLYDLFISKEHFCLRFIDFESFRVCFHVILWENIANSIRFQHWFYWPNQMWLCVFVCVCVTMSVEQTIIQPHLVYSMAN